jgi:hypothetical protein
VTMPQFINFFHIIKFFSLETVVAGGNLNHIIYSNDAMTKLSLETDRIVCKLLLSIFITSKRALKLLIMTRILSEIEHAHFSIIAY